MILPTPDVQVEHALHVRLGHALLVRLLGLALLARVEHAAARLAVAHGQEQSVIQAAHQQLRLQTEPILMPTTVLLSRVVGCTVVRMETRFTTKENLADFHVLVLS